MALRELSLTLCRQATKSPRSAISIAARHSRRYASGEAAAPQDAVVDQDLEPESSFSTSDYPKEKIEEFDPVKTAQGRQRQLPPSRYQYRSPRFYRGPLHPHQPPPSSDPSSRVFVPGPFSRTRLEETYQSTIAPDLMTLLYVHQPPGTVPRVREDRLRTWDDSSPYHKGRPKRGPRGPGERLRLIEKDVNWRNVPAIKEVTVHCMVKEAAQTNAHLHVAGILLQSLTGVRPTVHRVKHAVVEFGIRERQPISVTCTMRGEQAFDFVDRCVNLVFPRIKDWQGIKGSTGDGSGNLSFGIDKESTILFPEVEINYDMYPSRMIPGFHVTIKTSATSDRHARLLLGAIGFPFYGKLVN